MKGKLFIFIEGDDDSRFFGRVLTPRFRSKYRIIKLLPYAQQKRKETAKLIASVKKIGDCIYVRDINTSPCVTAKKAEVAVELPQLIESEMAIVVREIEGWYLAGLSENNSVKLGIDQVFVDTNNITKRGFDRLIPRGKTRVEFMLEILSRYSVEVAEGRNRSFGHFLTKWIQ